jgi:hypothetical protein
MKTALGSLCGLLLGLMLGIMACSENAAVAPDGIQLAAGRTQETEWICGLDAGAALGHFDPAGNTPSGSYGEDNDLTLAFGEKISPETRAYVEDIWRDVYPLVRAINGPPSHSITVTFVIDPELPYPGTFEYQDDEIRFRQGPDDDPNFDYRFTHELVHAFQDAAFDEKYVSWIAEGHAVLVPSLIDELIPRRTRGIWLLHRSPRQYESWSEMDRNAVAGCPFFFDSGGGTNNYNLAASFWWILTSSQSDADVGDWLAYDYLRRFNAYLYGRGGRFHQDQVLAAIAATATRPVDGRSAGAWAAAQPITWVDGTPGRFVFARKDVYLWLGLVERKVRGGPVTWLYGFVDLRVTDVSGGVVMAGRYQVADPGPLLPSGLPVGAYAIEVDGTGENADAPMLTAQVLGTPFREGDVVFAAYDPQARKIRMPPIEVPSDAEILEAERGIYHIRPHDPSHAPLEVDVEVATPTGPQRFARSIPGPDGRTSRFDLDWPGSQVAW